MKTISELKTNGGFVTENDLPTVIAANRLQPLLVRCGSCRFIVPADQAEHIIGIIGREGSDYVRDVSFSVTSV